NIQQNLAQVCRRPDGERSDPRLNALVAVQVGEATERVREHAEAIVARLEKSGQEEQVPLEEEVESLANRGRRAEAPSPHLQVVEPPGGTEVGHDVELPPRRLLLLRGEGRRRDHENREPDRRHPGRPAHGYPPLPAQQSSPLRPRRSLAERDVNLQGPTS